MQPDQQKTISGTKTYKELRIIAGVCSITFTKWLNMVPGLDRKPMQKVFTPAQVELITKHLGLTD